MLFGKSFQDDVQVDSELNWAEIRMQRHMNVFLCSAEQTDCTVVDCVKIQTVSIFKSISHQNKASDGTKQSVCECEKDSKYLLTPQFI